ncbi:Crp/Fnr family transcriptional regulator, partial [Kaarinaea lacus]
MEDFWFSCPHDFLSTISPQDQQSLHRLGTRRVFQKDEMVFNVGSASDDVFILLHGRVKVYELSREGKEVILWFCFPGELFGMAEVLRGGHREVNAQACCQVEVLAIKHADFEAFMHQRPRLALQVIELLSYRLRELSDVLLNMASDDVTSRVIKLITRLSARYGKPHGKGVHLDIPLTHQEMADMIGTSR